MAGRSEKKRSHRQKTAGFVYSLIAIICEGLWIMRNVIYPSDAVKAEFSTLAWRVALITVSYVVSVYIIYDSIRVGVSFSLSNDLFCLTTAVCVLSFFVNWAFKLFYIVPLYFLYKIGAFVVGWALTPEPEVEASSKRAEKLKRKYKVISARPMEVVEDVEVKQPTASTPAAGSEESHISAKLQGTELYKKGDLDGAIDAWFQGLRALQFILNKKEEFHRDAASDEDMQKKWDFFVTSYVQLSSNMSLALLKKGDYAGCIKYCNDALQYDKGNLKAFLRLTQANVELGQFNKAIQHCNEALQIHPENAELKMLKKKVLAQAAAHDRLQRPIMKGIFQRMETDPRSLSGPKESLVSKALSKAAGIAWKVAHPVLRFLGRYVKAVLIDYVVKPFKAAQNL
ncbi:tetratricopeptide repeat containing domain protein, putative [Babesia bigemina]|uniref:peptidylprolyl isomerase n=1 Tax=Babesia bigemina TaxID=5866 RepID=A0A061D564_BABBI|nr:LOW QUALITY PROTEIN: tetratricopeptide repeat containing domain protein, putative [Babesia bigemina]CDR95806.1 tetratricopeptide repeat containing domain protein, putative [Babesia bigemina]|eukprot:XP_012767992.1 LOW QUALITY PROTEIN: tetratricopeptide repeat containing domain protein, putative [Babesia bigemina]